MITKADIIYYSIYILCVCLSCIANSHNLKGLVFIKTILFLGLINETIVEIFQFYKTNENISHFIYIPCEYILMCCFFLKNTNSIVLKRLIYLSIPIYLGLAISLAAFYYKFQSYPSIIYNLVCFFGIIWSTLLLYRMDFLSYVHVLKTPAFWVLTGTLIFYSGVFFFNAVYNYYLSKNMRFASNLRTYINVTLNCIFYLFLCYSFICSIKVKKYLYPS